MPVPLIAYAGAYAVGQLGGAFIGTLAVQKMFPPKQTYVDTRPGMFDLIKELDRLGMNNKF